jgi:DNA-binding IclR family transcriptional regulator
MDVKTAGRTLDLFEAFAKAQTPLSLSELARALNAPPSSCFNLIRALQARGYLYSVQPRRQLYPTRRLFDVAQAIVVGEPWMARIEPVLVQPVTRRVRPSFSVSAEDQVVYLNVIEGPQSILYSSRAGSSPHSARTARRCLAGRPGRVAWLLQIYHCRASPRRPHGSECAHTDITRGRKQEYRVAGKTWRT